MGVRGYATFVKEKFKNWKPVDFKKWNHVVVIDGNNVCYWLYKNKCDWALGGEYDDFRKYVEEFFHDLGMKGLTSPIVAFDGVCFDEERLEIRKERKIKFMKRMQEKKEGRDDARAKQILSWFCLSLLMSFVS